MVTETLAQRVIGHAEQLYAEHTELTRILTALEQSCQRDLTAITTEEDWQALLDQREVLLDAMTVMNPVDLFRRTAHVAQQCAANGYTRQAAALRSAMQTSRLQFDLTACAEAHFRQTVTEQLSRLQSALTAHGQRQQVCRGYQRQIGAHTASARFFDGAL